MSISPSYYQSKWMLSMRSISYSSSSSASRCKAESTTALQTKTGKTNNKITKIQGRTIKEGKTINPTKNTTKSLKSLRKTISSSERRRKSLAWALLGLPLATKSCVPTPFLMTLQAFIRAAVEGRLTRLKTIYLISKNKNERFNRGDLWVDP